MSLHLERVHWMPSPSLVPDAAPIDIEHLSRMTLGEPSLEREVLAMFAAQTLDLIGRLAVMPEDAAALAHTLKGSARAIGAFHVAEAAQEVEVVIQGRGGDLANALQELQSAAAEANAAIEAILKHS
jgi:HPt (histidine-containing phosphotransfer) domain-containing protein